MTNLSEIDMVVLKRNDVNDATHQDKDDAEFKYRLIDNHWHVITEGNQVWRKSSITLEESPLFIKPIEKNMNTLDTDQDEPFLTPECTLNDQYAEIEQVRQAVKVKSGSDSDHALDAMSFGLMGARAAQASGGVDATLAERQSTYGNFEDVAFVTENIMSILAKVRPDGLDDLPNTHRMALYMIASKMARIVNGDFNSIDGWHDIAGYATLIERLIGVDDV